MARKVECVASFSWRDRGLVLQFDVSHNHKVETAMKPTHFFILNMACAVILLFLPNVQACMTTPDKLSVSGATFEKTNITALNQLGQVTLVFDDSPVIFDSKEKCWKLSGEQKEQKCLGSGFKTFLFDSTNTKKEGDLRVTPAGELKLYSIRPDGGIDMSKPALVFTAKSESVKCGADCEATQTSLEILAEQNGKTIGAYQVQSGSKDPRFRGFGPGLQIDLKGHQVLGSKDCASKVQIQPYGSSGGAPAGSQTSGGGGAT
jgi:hypothetical protein